MVRNGTLTEFFTGIDGNPGTNQGYIANVAIQDIVFSGLRSTSVSFFQMNNSSVTNCAFIGFLPGRGSSEFGIVDMGSQVGNKYVDNTFDAGFSTALSIGQIPVGDTLTIDCHVQP